MLKFSSIDGQIGELIGGNLNDFAIFPEDHGEAVLAVLLYGSAVSSIECFFDGGAVAENLPDISLLALSRFLDIHAHSLFTLFHKTSSKTTVARPNLPLDIRRRPPRIELS